MSYILKAISGGADQNIKTNTTTLELFNAASINVKQEAWIIEEDSNDLSIDESLAVLCEFFYPTGKIKLMSCKVATQQTES